MLWFSARGWEEAPWGGQPWGGLWVLPPSVPQHSRQTVPWLLRCPFCLVLQKLGTFGPLRCQEMYALDRLLREAQVLEVVCQLVAERAGAASSAADGKDMAMGDTALAPRGPLGD